MKKIKLIVLGMLVLTACKQQVESIQKKQLFKEVLEIHLNAIQNGNLDKLRPTVAENVSMISPDGAKIDSKKIFMDFHKNWFKMSNWEWKGDILNTENSDSLGYALIQYHFVQRDSVGNVLFKDKEYLALIFKNTAEGWQLVHDQNTRIKNIEDKSNLNNN